MARSVSVIDVAARAGVSLGTVSNVLNRPEKVAETTRLRVQAAIEELGFVRNEAARQLRAGRSRTIGLIVLDSGNPFFTDIAAGVERTAQAAGLSLVLCNSGEDPQREDHYLALLEEQRVSGILLVPVRTTLSRRVGDIRRRGTPIVLVDRYASGRLSSVSVDDTIGGRIALEHLVAQGHSRVAVVGGPREIKQNSDRLAGAREAWQAAGRSDASLLSVDTEAMNVASGRRAGEQIAEMPVRKRPTAAFCLNDLIALGLLQEMTRRRIAVPDEMAIVGYDDIEFAGAAAVPLTSVRQPREQLGHAAASLIIDELNETKQPHRQLVFEPELVVRESSNFRRPGRNRPAATR